jgi:hypothetical protein
MQGIFGLPEELLAYQFLCSLDLVSVFHHPSLMRHLSPIRDNQSFCVPTISAHSVMAPVHTVRSSHCFPHLTDSPTKQTGTGSSKTLVPVYQTTVMPRCLLIQYLLFQLSAV